MQLHRHTAHYRLLLSVCRLIHEEVLLTQEKGEYLFSDFTGNDKRMADLFERFVRNFYRVRQQQFKVKAEKLTWALKADSLAAEAVLPTMKTDVSLTSETRKIIIDCKYYREALKTYYDKERLISGHMYQLFAYVAHAEQQPPKRPVQGMLLYPVVKKELRFSYQLTGTNHELTIATVNLNQNWANVEQELLELLILPIKV